MEVSKQVLRGRYNTFSDQSLLAASAAGPGPFSPAAWEVIQELVVARGLAPPPAASGPGAPVAAKSAAAPPVRPVARAASPPLSPARSASAARPAAPAAPVESPYLILCLLGRAPWPADRALPTVARDVLTLAAFIFGVAGVGLLIAAVAHRGPRVLLEPGSPEFAAATALSLAFGLSTRRRSSPVTWGIALLYGGVAPVLALAPVGSAGAPLWPRLLVGGVIGACWVVYFVRRRESYFRPPSP